MRRGELVLLSLFAIGLLLWALPVRVGRVATGHDPEATWASASAESAPALPSLPAYAPVVAAKVGLESYRLDPKTATRLKLPARLREISGLALASDGRLLAHNDEEGIVFEIDLAKGEVREAFELWDSRGRLDDDFEGIAVTGEHVYLLSSEGRVYEALEAGAEGRVPCLVYDTRLGRDYEFEGLAYEPATRDLLLAAKETRGRAPKGHLYVFRWSVDTKRVVEGGRIEIPVKEIAKQLGGRGFNPSGIERHPLSGNYFLVAGRQHALAEITPEGALVAVRELPAAWHRQTEGIAFGPDYALILSDEGGSKRARLTAYPLLPL